MKTDFPYILHTVIVFKNSLKGLILLYRGYIVRRFTCVVKRMFPNEKYVKAAVAKAQIEVTIVEDRDSDEKDLL